MATPIQLSTAGESDKQTPANKPARCARYMYIGSGLTQCNTLGGGT